MMNMFYRSLFSREIGSTYRVKKHARSFACKAVTPTKQIAKTTYSSQRLIRKLSLGATRPSLVRSIPSLPIGGGLRVAIDTFPSYWGRTTCGDRYRRFRIDTQYAAVAYRDEHERTGADVKGYCVDVKGYCVDVKGCCADVKGPRCVTQEAPGGRKTLAPLLAAQLSPRSRGFLAQLSPRSRAAALQGGGGGWLSTMLCAKKLPPADTTALQVEEELLRSIGQERGDTCLTGTSEYLFNRNE
eukprot:904302-Prorocentrum_minimum.AAC.1